MHNSLKRDLRKRQESKDKYSELIKTTGSADSCIGCEQCVNVCPQHLDVPKLLAECLLELG